MLQGPQFPAKFAIAYEDVAHLHAHRHVRATLRETHRPVCRRSGGSHEIGLQKQAMVIAPRCICRQFIYLRTFVRA